MWQIGHMYFSTGGKYIPHRFIAGIGQLIQRDFWNFDFASKDFSNNDLYNAWLPAPGESIHESDSDNCLTELFGTG